MLFQTLLVGSILVSSLAEYAFYVEYGCGIIGIPLDKVIKGFPVNVCLPALYTFQDFKSYMNEEDLESSYDSKGIKMVSYNKVTYSNADCTGNSDTYPYSIPAACATESGYDRYAAYTTALPTSGGPTGSALIKYVINSLCFPA
jgi:hypothetical protein